MRQINEVIEDLSWPLPNILDLLDKSAGCKIWSAIDMIGGYQQMRIPEKYEHLTAFRCHLGVYY